MDITNKYAVSLGPKNQVVILNPPQGPISPADALLLAAWLVAIADAWTDVEFQELMDQVIEA